MIQGCTVALLRTLRPSLLPVPFPFFRLLATAHQLFAARRPTPFLPASYFSYVLSARLYCRLENQMSSRFLPACRAAAARTLRGLACPVARQLCRAPARLEHLQAASLHACWQVPSHLGERFPAASGVPSRMASGRRQLAQGHPKKWLRKWLAAHQRDLVAHHADKHLEGTLTATTSRCAACRNLARVAGATCLRSG